MQDLVFLQIIKSKHLELSKNLFGKELLFVQPVVKSIPIKQVCKHRTLFLLIEFQSLYSVECFRASDLGTRSYQCYVFISDAKQALQLVLGTTAQGDMSCLFSILHIPCVLYSVQCGSMLIDLTVDII